MNVKVSVVWVVVEVNTRDGYSVVILDHERDSFLVHLDPNELIKPIPVGARVTCTDDHLISGKLLDGEFIVL